MKVEVIRQFSIFMPNRPGALSRLTQLFTDGDVNILGIASEVRDDSGMVRIAVGNDKDLSGLLTKGGFASVESSLLSVEVSDKPGALSHLAKDLAAHKINITTVYGTALGQASRILFAVENTEKARKLLERLP